MSDQNFQQQNEQLALLLSANEKADRIYNEQMRKAKSNRETGLGDVGQRFNRGRKESGDLLHQTKSLVSEAQTILRQANIEVSASTKNTPSTAMNNAPLRGLQQTKNEAENILHAIQSNEKLLTDILTKRRIRQEQRRQATIVISILVISIIGIGIALMFAEMERQEAIATRVAVSTQRAIVLNDAIQRAGNFSGTRNTDWQPVEHIFDGVTMVLVPAGCFMMGSDDGERDERPVHEICFDEPFWIDKYEVTQAQYTYGYSTSERPVRGITWFEARRFCQSRSASLPTEAQWEYAARGVESWVYPWGNDFVSSNAVYNGSSAVGPFEVGSHYTGASWVGAMDMAGNVWEWTSSMFEPYPYNAYDGRERDANRDSEVARVLRGGSYNDESDYLRASFRLSWDPSDSHWGFRCVRGVVN
jgi:formylglycine-generating enzyme required for sulfatase activity